MSGWGEMMLGPARSVACDDCGKKVSVRWTALIALVPLLLSMVFGPKTGSFVIVAALTVLGALAMAFIHLVWVPLAPRPD